MTHEAFGDALAKGKGSVVLALRQDDPAVYADAILGACVENLQYDRQCEENRAEYVMRLVDLAGLGERALGAILAALPSAEEGWDRDWMTDLLEEFARRGETRAWDRLRELAEGGYERAQNNLATANEAGLEWVAANVLPGLPEDDRWRVMHWLPDEEADDQTPLRRRLRAIYNDLVTQNAVKRNARVKSEPTALQFFQSLDDPKAPYVHAVDFERLANVRQWRKAARRFLRETNERALRRLAQAFERDTFPLPAQRLFRQATHPERGWAVMRVLGTLDTPVVRRFALGLLRRRPLPWNGIKAITASLRPGDEPRVFAALASVEGEANTTRHGSILDVVGFMREHPKGCWQPHAEWIDAHSPCSKCRASAVDWMVEHGALPERIREEGAYDAEPEVRKAAARANRTLPVSESPW